MYQASPTLSKADIDARHALARAQRRRSHDSSTACQSPDRLGDAVDEATRIRQLPIGHQALVEAKDALVRDAIMASPQWWFRHGDGTNGDSRSSSLTPSSNTRSTTVDIIACASAAYFRRRTLGRISSSKTIILKYHLPPSKMGGMASYR